MKPRLYLAAPLFSEAEKEFNESIESRLADKFDVYLPQRDGCLVVDLVERYQIPWAEASQEVFERDIDAIHQCDLFLMILDGRVPDEGAAFELGFAHALGKTCWGLKTDPRQLLKYGSNPMLLGALGHTFESSAQLVEAARAWTSASVNLPRQE